MILPNLIAVTLYTAFTLASSNFTFSSGTGFISCNNALEIKTDTLKDIQLLYIGKEWHNLYSLVKGHQFLFINDYMAGNVTMNGKTFDDLRINYDIFNDEIIVRTQRGITVQLNKEMVDSFSLSDMNKTYRFLNMHDSLVNVGYVNVLYNKKSILYIKYKKEIQQLAVDEKYDQFFRTSRMFLLSDGVLHRITGKKDLLNIFKDDKIQIRDYIKKNKLKIMKNDPETFVPVIRYYDNLRK